MESEYVGMAALAGICIDGDCTRRQFNCCKPPWRIKKKPNRKSEPILYHMAAQAYLELERYAEAIDAFQKMESASKDDRVEKVAQEGQRKRAREGITRSID